MLLWGIALYTLGGSQLAQASLAELGETRPSRSVAPIQDALDHVDDDLSLRDAKRRRTEVGEYSEQDRFGQDERQTVDQTWLDKQAEIRSMEQASEEIHRSIAHLKVVGGSHEEALNSIPKLEDVHRHLEIRYRRKNKTGILRKPAQYKQPPRRVRFVLGADLSNSGESSSAQASQRSSNLDSGQTVFPSQEWDDLVRLTEPENEFCRHRPDFKLPFFETMFLIGDYMVKSNLLDPSFFKANNFFRPEALTQMIKVDLKSRLYGFGGLFFGFDAHSLLPTIQSLANHKSTKHLHRAIKVLDKENQKELVYDHLGNTMRSLDWLSARAWGEKSVEFGIVSSRFHSPYFIREADELSQMLIRFKGTPPSNDFRNNPIHSGTQHAINLFNQPPKLSDGKRPRLEFLMSYYYLDFLHTYYKEIVDHLQAANLENQKSEKKRKFLGEAIKIFTDPADPWKPKFDKYSRLIFQQKPHDDLEMKEWIEAITSIILELKVSGVIDRAFYIAMTSRILGS
ncbi:hypothetical protein PGT21_027776 [Puccinia graminis f. sp. tritici]|uniref:Uncharacterized protein n=1 Tax=Puccinia graminis f. sp. tritici TaxID=56615 RepID=A0A5B0QJM7_PUCGR|nr:hypothetical protein PGT21_027776 [Puccinia graminis f. sp. tritici]